MNKPDYPREPVEAARACGNAQKRANKPDCRREPVEAARACGNAQKRANKPNYQKELDKLLEGLTAEAAGEKGNGCAPTLLLHSCCGPCSSYVLEYLRKFFRITVFYYNPNISPLEEYVRRREEQLRLIAAFNEKAGGNPVDTVEGDYEPELFFRAAKGLEQCPEGGERCGRCFELRLRKTADLAARLGSGYFATTLTVSPHKDAEKLNLLGQSLAREYGVRWLPSDFKKREGYKRSIELSAKYGLYRQDYCGCAFSRREPEPGGDGICRAVRGDGICRAVRGDEI